MKDDLRNTRIYKFRDDDFEAVYYRLGWKTNRGDATVSARSARGESEYAKENRHKRIQKAKSTVRRLIKTYDLGRFVTLTFKENQKNVKEADHEFRKFMKRLLRRYPDFKYVAIREFQDRGAVHYHMAINRFIEHAELAKIWGHGFVWIEKKQGDSRKMANYISKYLTKYSWDERLKGYNLYLRSHGLELIYEDIFFSNVEELLDHLVVEYPNMMKEKSICKFNNDEIAWIG